ncbi:MAG: hypothetical protein AAF959_15220 [Cyanobacteria bacterium P01_D01_bin.56]
MAAIKLLQSSRLVLVNCQIVEGIVKAGWAYTYGLLSPVESLEGSSKLIRVSIPSFMQQDQVGGELFDPNDTVDFLIADD